MSTLTHMNAHSYAYRDDGTTATYGAQGYPTSFWSAILPNIQGQGPIASAMRIALKLRHQTWIPSFVTSFLGKELGGGRRKEEELQSQEDMESQRGLARKVLKRMVKVSGMVLWDMICY